MHSNSATLYTILNVNHLELDLKISLSLSYKWFFITYFIVIKIKILTLVEFEHQFSYSLIILQTKRIRRLRHCTHHYKRICTHAAPRVHPWSMPLMQRTETHHDLWAAGQECLLDTSLICEFLFCDLQGLLSSWNMHGMSWWCTAIICFRSYPTTRYTPSDFHQECTIAAMASCHAPSRVENL